MADTVTVGIHHVGLAVRDLDAARSFFVDCLGWKVVGGKVQMMLQEPGGNRLEFS